MPDAAEVGVGVEFKALVPVGLKCDSLHYFGLHTLENVDGRVSVGRSRILGEEGAFIHCISDIRPGAILQ